MDIAPKGREAMSKNIVFCADGTWNSPDQDDDNDKISDPTNVCKLFRALNGKQTSGDINSEEQEKKLLDPTGKTTLQTAKYLYGVGCSDNLIVKMLGGVAGAGVISRIVRGYTFISRHYQPGDQIYLIGFSRGAYTVRALADMIMKMGLLKPEHVQDPETGYRDGIFTWYKYRSKKSVLLDLLSSLAKKIKGIKLSARDYVKVEGIKAIGVWDTVGAMGIPVYAIKGKRRDLFKFTSTRLSKRVEHGFHAVALDEQRVDFTPTLWDQTANVTQNLFPGGHADVGGGYPIKNNESGLSDGALVWMVDNLKQEGLLIQSGANLTNVKPDAKGTAHQQWRVGAMKWKTAPRQFPRMNHHQSVDERKAAGPVIPHPGVAKTPYNPANLPKPLP